MINRKATHLINRKDTRFINRTKFVVHANELEDNKNDRYFKESIYNHPQCSTCDAAVGICSHSRSIT